MFRRARIQVCLLDETCHKNILKDRDVGVIFVFEHETLIMTTMCWPLSYTRLQGGQLLFDIVTLYIDVVHLEVLDCAGFQGILRNPYWSVRQKLLAKDHSYVSNLQVKPSDKVVWKISS